MDVQIFQTPDGGEVTWIDGNPVMSDGLDSAVYLSMFGGNIDDDGSDGAKSLQWWGNVGIPDPLNTYRSETGFLLRSLAAVPVNLRRLEDAVGRDLAWLVDSKLAQSVGGRATIPKINSITLVVAVVVDGKTSLFSFQKTGSS